MISQLFKRPFGISSNFFIGLSFVNAAIRQVDEFIVHIFLFEAEFMGTESDEPFLVNENCQRRDAGYQNVETQIPFEALDEKRVCDVPLDDHSLGERALV